MTHNHEFGDDAASVDVVHKVIAFVTRGSGVARELLVFRHPSGGVQLPAGTVERDEPIEQALLREVWEETGLVDLEGLRHLATLTEITHPDHRIVSRTVPFRREPCETAPCIPLSLGGGLVIEEVGRGWHLRRLRDGTEYTLEAGFTKVGHDVYDSRGRVIIETIEGWVPPDALCADVRRHLFHLRTAAPTPDRWSHDGDVPGCELFWVPLDQEPGLRPWQSAWLAAVLEHLKRAP